MSRYQENPSNDPFGRFAALAEWMITRLAPAALAVFFVCFLLIASLMATVLAKAFGPILD